MTRPSVAVALTILIILLAAGTTLPAPADTVTVAPAPVGAPGIFQPPAKLLHPTEWANLRLWPARHAESFTSGTTNPALASYAGKLLLVEVYQGGLYLSQLEPDSLKVIGKTKLSGLPSGRTVVKGVLWVTWISQAAGEGHQMFLQHNLQTAVSASPVEEHSAVGCSLAVFSGQLWVLWRSPGPSGGLYLARYDTTSGLGRSQQWPIQRDEWVSGSVADMGGELLLAGIKTATLMELPAPIKPPPNQSSVSRCDSPIMGGQVQWSAILRFANAAGAGQLLSPYLCGAGWPGCYCVCQPTNLGRWCRPAIKH